MTDTVRVPKEPNPALLPVIASIVCRLALPTNIDPDEVYFDNGHARQIYAAIVAASPQGEGLTVDALAQEIRRVDGDNTLGAGALAGALMPFLTSPQGEGSSADVKPTDGDLWWNPDNYEDGFLHWADAFENANEDGADYSVELHRARKLPPVWGALVWIDGEQKIKIFATEAEADDVRVTEGVKP